jgi:hypothetical protein
MKYIELTQNKKAIVDDDDYEWLNQWKWRCSAGRYASRANYNNGVRVGEIWMHRLINNTPDGYDTDHINRNKLDNRRNNLRSVTRSQNNFNSLPPKNNQSGFKGVILHKQTGKWFSYINIERKQISLGLFQSKTDAIKARLNAENRYGVCI